MFDASRKCPECGKPLRLVYVNAENFEFWKCVKGHRVRFVKWDCTVVKMVYPVYMFEPESNIGPTRGTNVESVSGGVAKSGVKP